MTTLSASDITSQALALPIAVRSELAATLLKSIETDLPHGQRLTPSEWEAEIMRRSDELHAGKAESISGRESIAQVRELIRKSGQS